MLVAAGSVAGATPAGATFPNSTNGLIVFSSSRSNALVAGGANLYLVNPAAVKAAGASDVNDPKYTTDLTATAFDDHQPFFSSDGTTVVFASDRGGTYRIWKVLATNVPSAADVTGTASPAADGAVRVSPASESNDCWPSLNAGGTTLVYLHGAICSGGGGSASTVETLDLTNPAATPVVIATGASADRPVFNPANSSQLLYVNTGTSGSQSDIILVTNPGPGATVTDLSQSAGVGTNGDEHPDWAPNGGMIVFDSNRPINAADSNGTTNQLWVMTPSGGSPNPVYVQAQVSGPNIPVFTGQTDFEPVFSPDGTQLALARIVTGQDVADTDMVKLTASDQIVVPVGGTPDNMGSDLTLDSTTSPGGGVTETFPTDNEPNWQGTGVVGQLPETRWVIGLPVAGAVLLGGAVLVLRRRSLAPARS
jgi:Tol biopolymer transport system component